jgi:DNA-binding transcriptional LysR family regulator
VTSAKRIHIYGHVSAQPQAIANVFGGEVSDIAVAESDLVAFVPRRLAIQSAEYLPLRIEELPFEGAELVEYLHWHPSRTKNASSMWLRDLLKLALTKI